MDNKIIGENPLENNLIEKLKKTKIKLPHVNKNDNRESNFCSNTVFSLV